MALSAEPRTWTARRGSGGGASGHSHTARHERLAKHVPAGRDGELRFIEVLEHKRPPVLREIRQESPAGLRPPVLFIVRENAGDCASERRGSLAVQVSRVMEGAIAVGGVPAVEDDEVRMATQQITDFAHIASVKPALLALGLPGPGAGGNQPVDRDSARGGQVEEPLGVPQVDGPGFSHASPGR